MGLTYCLGVAIKAHLHWAGVHALVLHGMLWIVGR